VKGASTCVFIYVRGYLDENKPHSQSVRSTTRTTTSYVIYP